MPRARGSDDEAVLSKNTLAVETRALCRDEASQPVLTTLGRDVKSSLLLFRQHALAAKLPLFFLHTRKGRTTGTDGRTSFTPGSWTGATDPRWFLTSAGTDPRTSRSSAFVGSFFLQPTRWNRQGRPSLEPPTDEFSLGLASVSPLSLLPDTSSSSHPLISRTHPACLSTVSPW